MVAYSKVFRVTDVFRNSFIHYAIMYAHTCFAVSASPSSSTGTGSR